MTINSLDQLRKFAVKHILRQGPADYLLRQSLCKPWVASDFEDEMAWTDFRSLFFNFPKIRAQLDSWTKPDGTPGGPIDPGEHTTAFLAAACHEILHVLWLHRWRAKDKHHLQWKYACEFAINYELAKIFGKDWISHLGVMYPPQPVIQHMADHGLDTTTDGFYQALVDMSIQLPPVVACGHCDRGGTAEPAEEEEQDLNEMIRALHQLPEDHPERADILKYISNQVVPVQKMPWEMLLLGGIENAVSQEQSWATPSRRNDMLPGWRHEKYLNFVWILDVSPSIDAEMKLSFMNTLQAGINLYHDAQHRVIFFADGIVDDFVVSSGTNLNNYEVPCGSGTCLNEVWEVLERDMPEYALVLTDLELYAVPKPTYTKIIWGIIGDYRMFDPDYGVKIQLN